MADNESFSIGNDLIDLINNCATEDGIWILLEWARQFYKRTGLPAHILDLMRETPDIVDKLNMGGARG